MRLISRLINGIAIVFKKLHKSFNATITSTSFALPSTGVFPFIFILDLNDSDSLKLLFGSHLCNIVTNFQMFLNNHHFILSNYTFALLYQRLQSYFFCIILSLLQLVNGAQFSNITPLLL